MADDNATATDLNETAPPEAAADDASLSAETKALAAQGFAVVDEWPANHRLRAEALVAAGKTSDPAGHISDDMIAETSTRVVAEADELAERDAAEAKAHKPATARMGRDKLVELAAAESVQVQDDDTATVIAANIEAARAANKEG